MWSSVYLSCLCCLCCLCRLCMVHFYSFSRIRRGDDAERVVEETTSIIFIRRMVFISSRHASIGRLLWCWRWRDSSPWILFALCTTPHHTIGLHSLHSLHSRQADAYADDDEQKLNCPTTMSVSGPLNLISRQSGYPIAAVTL